MGYSNVGVSKTIREFLGFPTVAMWSRLTVSTRYFLLYAQTKPQEKEIGIPYTLFPAINWNERNATNLLFTRLACGRGLAWDSTKKAVSDPMGVTKRLKTSRPTSLADRTKRQRGTEGDMFYGMLTLDPRIC